MARPKGPDLAMLAERGVTASQTGTTGQYALECNSCGRVWTVDTVKHGLYDAGEPVRLPAGYWRCPSGCNAPQPTAAPATSASTPGPVLSLGDLPAVLTPAEAAALLRVSVTTVKDWARAGDLPGAFKVGKEWRVERDALLAHIRGGQA